MSYDEEQQRKSRVVVETPTARREVVHSETRRIPEERQGFSTGMVALVAIAAVAITALLFFFLTRGDETTNTNVPVATQPTPFVMPTPLAQQPPTTIIQPAPPTTMTQPPVVITQPAPETTAPPSSSGTTNQPDDLALEDRVRRSVTADSQLAAITVRASQGRVRLEGIVPSQELKRRAEQLARDGGARSIENRITVTEGMQPSSNTPPPQ